MGYLLPNEIVHSILTREIKKGLEIREERNKRLNEKLSKISSQRDTENPEKLTLEEDIIKLNVEIATK